MAINKIPQRAFDNDDMLVDVYTATAGQTAFTMSRAAAVNSVLVHVNDVIQQPTVDYTVSGTTLTFTSALSVNDDVRIRMMTERPLGSQSGGSGATTLGALNDVSSATPATGQVLKWSGTQWAPDSDLQGSGGSSYADADVDTHLNTSTAATNEVLSWDGSDYAWVTNSGSGGIGFGDLSVGTEGTASGDGALSYNNSGEFTYTPPTLSGLTAGGDVDLSTNKILFSNVYTNIGDLPSASSYHGMFAHVHGTGKAYYAHAGNWVELANNSQLTLDGLSDVSTSGVTSGQVLKYNGTSWAPAADSAGSSGIALGDLSVGAEGTASGDGSLSYNNTTGVFTYTPPVIPYVALPDDQEFGVTNNGASAYTFSGAATGDNPTITLERGKTYRFDVNASGHPFAIRLSSGGSAYTNGVENADAQVGAIYFTVPDDAPDSLVYQCTVHSAMVGTINVIDKAIPGHIIQRVTASGTNTFTTSSSSWATSVVTGTITPRYSNSIIHGRAVVPMWRSSTSAYIGVRTVNSGGNTSQVAAWGDSYFSASGALTWQAVFEFKYTAGSTSAITSTFEVNASGGGTWFPNNASTFSSETGFVRWYFTLQEEKV